MLGIDGQRMKRLSEKDGNIEYLKWLQYEKESNVILPENIVSWFCQENIKPSNLDFITEKMSMVQIYNYIRRQMEENHENSRVVLTTWSDYLAMAERLKIDTNDAIIYRVRELFKRHGELVERCRRKGSVCGRGSLSQRYLLLVSND